MEFSDFRHSRIVTIQQRLGLLEPKCYALALDFMLNK